MQQFTLTNRTSQCLIGTFNFCILEAANEETDQKYFLVKFPEWTRDTSYCPYYNDDDTYR